MSPIRRTTNGVTVFSAEQEPWREVAHLLVLGFAEGDYPGQASGNPLFLDSEIREINESCGLGMRTRAEAMSARLDRFVRQIGIASTSLTLLSPYRSLAGDRVSPAASLPLFARSIEGGGNPEELIVDLDALAEADWPSAIPRSLETKSAAPLFEHPQVNRVNLGRDLLALRTDKNGAARRQSPSRLETLIVSPLAWLLNEMDATEEVWGPEQADFTSKGSLAHKVFEGLFRVAEPLPSPDEIRERVPRLLHESIRQVAPFMQAARWTLERKTLEEEILGAALRWREALVANGAEVIGNEFWLRGAIFGVEVHGMADSLLRLSDGQLIIVDHKKSSSKNRLGRLEAGWDLQVELYRTMARTAPSDEEVGDTPRLLAEANGIGVAYHLMNDGGVLVHGAGKLGPGFQPVAGNISGEAMTKLGIEIERVRRGEIVLNTQDDRKFFANTAHMGLYAFDVSPLVDASSVELGDRKGDLGNE
jgi:hypothetical protein